MERPDDVSHKIVHEVEQPEFEQKCDMWAMQGYELTQFTMIYMADDEQHGNQPMLHYLGVMCRHMPRMKSDVG